METLKSEFRLKQLGFSTIVPDRVFFSMWRIPPIAVIFYKLVLAIYVDYWLIKTADADHTSTWSIWLTNWTYTLLVIHLNMSTLAVIVYHLIRSLKSRAWLFSRSPAEHWRLMQDDVSTRGITTESHSTELDSSAVQTDTVQSSSTPWYVIAPLWVFFDMSASFVPVVTLLYFAFLWRPPLYMADLQFHGINSVCMFIDLLLSSIPVRILHVIYPVIYGLTYVIFSAIYWAGGHRRAMYPIVLDWNHTGETIGMNFAVFLIVFVLQLLLFALHKLKVYIYLKLHGSGHCTLSQPKDSNGLSNTCLQRASHGTLKSLDS